MEENAFSEQKDNFSQQIKYILETTGLEIAGFSLLTGISDSHLYGLANGNKNITKDTASKIAEPLKLKPASLLQPGYKIPDTIKNAPAIRKFYSTYKKGNPEYFTETKPTRKNSYIIEHDLIPGGLFEEPVYNWQVRDAYARLGIEISSKQVSQYLNYLVETKKLRSEMRKLKKKNGETAERQVHVYSRIKPDNKS